MSSPVSSLFARLRSASRGRKIVLSIGAVAALGAATALPAATAQETSIPDIDLGQIGDLLENELILDYVEVCQNADGSTPVLDQDSRPTAVADCSQSTGTGIAIILPESIEVGSAAEGMIIDLGDDISILGLTYKLGERNLIEILSAAALGSNTIKNIVGGLGLPKIDPSKLGAYSSYEQVQRDANLPYKAAYRTENGACKRKVFGICVEYEKVQVEYDGNLAKRTEALKIAEYLTGEKYDYTKPVELPGAAAPRGSSTVIGDGMQVAASMRDGTAVAEAHELLGLPGIALAGADEGRSSISYAKLGFASALNMDTNEIGITWFGQAIDFTKLREAGITDFTGEEIDDMLTMVDNLEVPALKEVSCFGLNTRATAEGLGTCTNILGTFDSYQDLRDPVAGEHRQTQFGLTDVTSLVLGNDALLKQLTGKTEDTPFLDDLMKNLTSEDDRLKFAKDFVRFTSDKYTEEIEVAVLDDEGNPVLDEEGNPVTETTTRTTTAAWLTSDYGLREPVTVEWLGYRVVFFPAVEVNGTERPNYLSLPEISRLADDADSGILPKVSLVTWDNAFGLGTVTLDDLSRPGDIYANWKESVTLGDDITWLGELLGQGDATDGNTEDGAEGTGSTEGTDNNSTESPESADPASTPTDRNSDGTADVPPASSTESPPPQTGPTEDAPTTAPSAEPEPQAPEDIATTDTEAPVPAA